MESDVKIKVAHSESFGNMEIFLLGMCKPAFASVRKTNRRKESIRKKSEIVTIENMLVVDVQPNVILTKNFCSAYQQYRT